MTTLRSSPAAKLIGLTALVSSALYLLSDVIEVLQGGFSSGQLWLTLIAETAVPIFVVGLAVLQRPRLGRLGELSAWTYAYSYVFFTGTVVYALVNGTKDYAALTDKLGAVMVVHGALMVLAGLGFGYAVRRARLLPPWTAITLMAGVVLVALAQNLPDGAQLATAGIRDLGFAGMGVGLLRIGASRARGPHTPHVSSTSDCAYVDLYWLPLGAGDASHCVRFNGRIYEALVARRAHREVRDLYHSALEVHVGTDRFVIEMAPTWGNTQADRGVVGTGSVGLPWLGRSRFFRYEVRRWRNGSIPDVSEAVASPQRLSSDVDLAHRVLDLVPMFPTVTWGRDELHTGDMWNSNSLIAWLLVSSGHALDLVEPPARGRAPGWLAGLVVGARQVDAARVAVEVARL